MVGEIRHPARDPALPRLRRRPLRPAARHPLRHSGHVGDLGRGRATLAAHDQQRRASVSCRYYIMASGCLSAPKPPEIDGFDDFKGEIYFTGRWPHEEVELRRQACRGHRHGIVGDPGDPDDRRAGGPSDCFPAHAELRFPGAQWPAAGGPRRLAGKRPRKDYREQARWSLAGVPLPRATEFSWQLSEAERRERFDKALAAGDLVVMLTQLWADQGVDLEGNALAADLLRERIRSIVKDPETAEALTPRDHPFGSKRPCLETNYYATFNRPNVTLVNLRQEPIKSITASGIKTDRRTFDVDVIVFATGFDAMTGAIMAVHPITGRGGKSLVRCLGHGPQTYLGLTVAGFPNLFMVTGPGSPSVLSNMAVSIEQHADWVVDRLIEMREAGFTAIEATETAQAGWARHMADCSALTLHRLANTWYTGANVPGKAQGVMPYTGGVGPYRAICNEVVSRGMLGFKLTGAERRRAMQRRRDRSPATRRAAGAEHAGGPEAAAAGIVRRPGRARLRRPVQRDPSRRPAGRRGRRRHAGRCRRSAALPPLSAGDAGPASDRGLFPWRRLGAGGRTVRRSVLPRHVPAHRDDLR